MEKLFTVCRDSREKNGNGWFFPENSLCGGTIIKTMKTGDYSLIGLEDKFVIERKGKISEFVTNITEDRFWNEMDRLEEFEHAFLVLEFTLRDIYTFPQSSDIPKFKQKYIKIKPQFIMKKLSEIELNYKTKIVFVDSEGPDWAENIFKYVSMKYGNCKTKTKIK